MNVTSSKNILERQKKAPKPKKTIYSTLSLLEKHFVLMDRKQLVANIFFSWKTEVNYNSKWAFQYQNRAKFKPCMAWFGHPTAGRAEGCGTVLAQP